MKRILILLASVVWIGAATTAQADIVQFDFGSTGNVYNAAGGPADTTVVTWNGVGTGSGLASGILQGDGTAATGVSIELGEGSTIDWNAGIDRSRDNAAGDTELLDTALTQTWFFGVDENLGARVSGLAAGEYDVYSIHREPGGNGRTYDVGIGVSNTGDIADLTVSSIAAVPANPTAFVEGESFVTQRVTVTDVSDFITVIVSPTNSRFASISGLQIVAVPPATSPVPEPSSLAIMLGLGITALARRKRS